MLHPITPKYPCQWGGCGYKNPDIVSGFLVVDQTGIEPVPLRVKSSMLTRYTTGYKVPGWSVT